jgi:hypothetical protein
VDGKTKGFIEPKGSRAGGRREKVRGEYMFSSLMKQKIKINKRQKLRCLLLRRKKKITIFIFMM